MPTKREVPKYPTAEELIAAVGQTHRQAEPKDTTEQPLRQSAVEEALQAYLTWQKERRKIERWVY